MIKTLVQYGNRFGSVLKEIISHINAQASNTLKQ